MFQIPRGRTSYFRFLSHDTTHYHCTRRGVSKCRHFLVGSNHGKGQKLQVTTSRGLFCRCHPLAANGTEPFLALRDHIRTWTYTKTVNHTTSRCLLLFLRKLFLKHSTKITQKKRIESATQATTTLGKKKASTLHKPHLEEWNRRRPSGGLRSLLLW